MGLIIAVDGPAASGKGTIAGLLGKTLGLAVLDTGLLYRAVGLAVLAAQGNPEDPADAQRAAEALQPAMLQNPALRSAAAAAAASCVAVHPQVRLALLGFQRQFADHPPGNARGAVLDGRDIGTVVLPHAALKLYITASPEVRARRRYEETVLTQPQTLYENVLADICTRDLRDRSRSTAPLRAAADAVVIDTDNLSITKVLDRCLHAAAAVGIGVEA